MHTAKVLGAGLGLLTVCVIVGRIADERQGASKGTLVFLPLWLAGTAANMYLGVKNAGYSFGEELPIAAAVFAGPALLALGLRTRLR